MYDPALHLFIDDFHIRNQFAMQRVFGRLEKHPDPVLEDISGRQATWGTVMCEPDGRFRLWYQSVCDKSVHEMSTAGVYGRGEEFGYFPECLPGAVRETQTSVISYAESADGFRWEKPDLGLVEWQGSKENNIVLDGSYAAEQFDGALTNMDTVSVIRDDVDPNPQRRYKMICHWETIHVWDNRVSNLGRSEEYMAKVWAARAKYMTTSPDGIRWNPALVRIKECAGGGDYAGVTRDERNQRYWFSDRAPVGLPGMKYRTAGLCTSPDLYNWPETVEMVFSPAAHEDYGCRYEHHGMVPFNYGDQDLCFLEYSIAGCPIAGILGSHRDGERWRLVNGSTPFLSLGPKGTFDADLVAMTRNSPFRKGDQLVFFYNGRVFDYDDYHVRSRQSRIGAATLRLDGFAGMAVDELAMRRHRKPAMLLTQPVRVLTDELQINIANHRGTARVALLDKAGQMIPGYELENCLPIEDDAVRAGVHWKEQPAVSALRNQELMVLVQLEAGTVYAIRL